MNAEVIDLIEEEGTIAGVKAKTKDGLLCVRAKLTIGADGRSSIVRQRAGMAVEDLGAPMDVLWLRISKKDTDPGAALGRVRAGVIFIMLNRRHYWQCGFVIPKGTLDQYKNEGLAKFRQRIKDIAPFLGERVAEVHSWDDVRLLTVKLDRLKKWYRQGLLCIGDSAHAMSPIGGVGINLAVQDAVAAANILYFPLLHNYLVEEHLRDVQERRMFPTVMTQRLQAFAQRRFVQPMLASSKPIKAPLIARLLGRFPVLRRIPAALIGIGFRAEHIHVPERNWSAPRPPA
jgi:2-polyprenyl-6-methoxyphenol hydroxylase-like FAD-dependent oxidoreductase